MAAGDPDEARGRKLKVALTREEEDLFSIICKRVTDGAPLYKVLKAKSMPTSGTFYRWLNHYDPDGQLKQQYAIAIVNKADKYVDEDVDIADNQNKSDIRRATLRVKTRLDVAALLNPKKYSAKMVLGGDPTNPVEHNHTVSSIDPTKMSKAALLEFMKARREIPEPDGS